MKNRNSKKQAGYVSTEVGIAIFVISLLTIAGFLSVQFLVNDSTSSVLVTQTIDTVKNIRTKYRYQAGFSGITPQVVIDLNAAPRNMIFDTKIANSYGGDVDFEPTTCTIANDCLEVTQNRLPSNACIDYVNGMFEMSDTVSVNDTAIKTSGMNTIDSAALTTACGNASNKVTTSHTKV